MNLLAKWEVTMASLNVTKGLSANWHNRICTHYQEPQRHYHTMEHIKELFEYRDRFQPKLKKVEVVDLAIWFHDVIYQPTSATNEEDSAKLLNEFASEAGLDEDLRETIFKYIIATKTHKIDPSSDDTDLKYFLDFDLAVLGKPTEDYNRYAHQIRREYIHVPDEKYLTGRAAVLDHLRQGDLYFTAEFRELFDSKARENLSREIVSLKQGNVYI